MYPVSASGSCSRGYLFTRSRTWFDTSAGNQRVRSRPRSLGPTCAGAAAWTLISPGVLPAAASAFAQLRDEPADEVRIGELEDEPVRHPTGHGQGHGPVAGDPHRQPPLAGPGQLQLGALVGDRPALDEVADDADRFLEGLHRGRRLAQHAAGQSPRPMPRSIRPPLSSSGPPGWMP